MPVRAGELVGWMHARLAARGARGFVLPFAATLESAVVARLCQRVSPQGLVGALLAIPNETLDQRQRLAEFLQLRVLLVDSTPVEALTGHLAGAAQHLAATGGHPDTTALAAGFRRQVELASLRFLAGALNHVVTGTLDRTDLTLGTYVPHADTAADLLPLGHCFRSDVHRLARELDLPETLIDAGVKRDDERRAAAGFSHLDLERYLADGPDAVAPATALRIERMMRESGRTGGSADIPTEESESGLD